MSNIIDAKNLKYSYPVMEGEKPKDALRGVSVTVEKGQFVAVLGHNGSGKSTFAKHINVLLKAQEDVYKRQMQRKAFYRMASQERSPKRRRFTKSLRLMRL